MKLNELTPKSYWPNPKSFNVGLFTDLRLYYDALVIAEIYPPLTVDRLNEYLPERVMGLKYVPSFKNKTSEDILRELQSFNFIQKGRITNIGKDLINLYKHQPTSYHHQLIKKMQDYYVVPGWFVSRLWSLNNTGQGEIVIPSPIKDWEPKPSKRDWEKNRWDMELNQVCIETISRINKVLPGSFPINVLDWTNKVKIEYERIGQSREKKKYIRQKKINEVNFFSLRRRLSICMRNVTIKELFSNINPITNKKEFYRSREPVNSRTFMVWCSRLEALELIFYTDYIKQLPGRLIFPTSLFRDDNKIDVDFERLKFIQNPLYLDLCLHRPMWGNFKDFFLETIYEVYQYIYNVDGVIYVSLQQLRDEVCRLLRISASTFEIFLQKSFDMSIKREINFAISLETDIRDDQKTQVLRRGVFLNGLQHSLIAIRKY